MVVNFTSLSLIESKVECQCGDKACDTNIKHHVWHISVTVGIEGVVSKFITIWFVMSVWLVHDQVSVGVWREDVLVTALMKKLRIDDEM